MTYEPHPAAQIFPMMAAAELKELAGLAGPTFEKLENLFMTPEGQQQPQEKPEDPRPRQTAPPAEAPQSQSLLDRIVSETQIAQRDAIIIRRAEFDQKQRLARMFANSGCFKDIDRDEKDEWLPEEVSIARALVKIELGEAMGFSAAESMTGIDIIKGRVAVGAALRGARMQRAGYSWPQLLVTEKGCWMPLCYKGDAMMCPKLAEDGSIVLDGGKPVMVQVVVSFTEKDARMLGLLDKNASMYKKDPSSMYYARTITRAQRRYGPGVLGVDILDTYEARDVDAPPLTEITRTQPPDNDPRWFEPGSAKAADDLAAQKIAEMESCRAKNAAPVAETAPVNESLPGADTGEPTKAAKQQEAPQEATVGGFPSWGTVKATHDGDENAAELGKIITVGGKTYTRESFEQTWSVVASNIPPASKPRPVPVFGRKTQ